ncbi:MAG: fumarylacetoacetate hydrolase family protein [Geminicoccaceae bacterium]|nr:fumarylacetoacetate hydrolase family protein [Geminicoccaceae bacterium]
MTAETAARALADAFRSRSLVDPPEEAALADGYAVQRLAVEAAGGDIAGWKIGATNEKACALLKTDGPFYGPIMASANVSGEANVAAPPGLAAAEIELAFRLAADLPRRAESYTIDELRAAIASAHPAIELIGVRQKLAGPLTAARAIPDFGGNVLFTAGAAIDGWQDVAACEIAACCLVNGEEKNAGTADIVLGDPLESLRWLADNGPGLRAGQWISTGTITGVTPVRAGDSVTGDFGVRGSISIRLDV